MTSLLRKLFGLSTDKCLSPSFCPRRYTVDAIKEVALRIHEENPQASKDELVKLVLQNSFASRRDALCALRELEESGLRYTGERLP